MLAFTEVGSIRRIIMKVLIVGGGGREHTIALKIAENPQVTNVKVGLQMRLFKGNAKVNNKPIAVMMKPKRRSFNTFSSFLWLFIIN